MTDKQFLTIAGRWKEHVKAAGLEHLSKSDQAKSMLLFYAGFAAALDATLELAELYEAEAMHMLSSLHQEVKLVTSMAAIAIQAGTLGAQG